MSVWRIARDKDYVKWAKDIGTEKCQITFFGLEENTDYFAGRKGAFKDNLIATDRLIEEGIVPRWQLFLNEKNKGELQAFTKLIEDLKFEDRVKSMGKEFEFFAYLPAPYGEAFNLESIRPKADIVDFIPKYLKDKTLKHCNAKDMKEILGYEESKLLPKLLENNDSLNDYPFILSLMITSDFEVYCNAGEVVPWWSLGNLNKDSVKTIMDNYINNASLGLKLMYEVPISELAKECGNIDGRSIYTEEDLIMKYIHMYGEKLYKKEGLK